MKFNINYNKGIKFLRPETKELGLFKKDRLEENFIFDNCSYKTLAIDLNSVISIDSSILGLFIRYSDVLKNNNKKLVLFGISEYLSGVFRLTMIDCIIPILESKQDVIDKFGQ